jgi:hypothetical protein
MSTTKKVTGSIVKRGFMYVADITMSIVLLVVICLSFVFVVPMWIQYVLLRTPTANLALNPIVLFGFIGAIAATLLLAATSMVLGYVYVVKTKPKAVPAGEKRQKPPKKEKAEVQGEIGAEAEPVTEEEVSEDLEETLEEDETEDSEPDEEDTETES